MDSDHARRALGFGAPRTAWLRFGLPVALMSMALCAGAAHAQGPSAQDRDRARDSMLRGDELFGKGDFDGALKMYRAADAIMAVPSTGLAVARALRLTGRLMEAREAAERVRSSKPSAKEPTAFAKARQDAGTMIEELDRRIPTLALDLSQAPAEGGLRILLDGVLVGRAEAEAPRRLPAGSHTIAAYLEGYQDLSEQLVLHEGDKKTLVIRLTKKPLAEAPSTPGPAEANSQSPVATTSTWAYVGLGVGAAGLVAGGVTGLISWSKASSVKDQCDGSVCPLEVKGDADSARTLGWVSNISFGVGVAGLAVGTVLLLSGGKPQEPKPTGNGAVRLRPVVGLGAVGLQGQF
jgi:hypothetical protein